MPEIDMARTLSFVSIVIVLSGETSEAARPFQSVFSRVSSWRRRGQTEHHVPLPIFGHKHSHHKTFLPTRLIPRGGGSSASAATTAAYADFFDGGLYSDGGGSGNAEVEVRSPNQHSYKQQHLQDEQWGAAPPPPSHDQGYHDYNQQQPQHHQQEEGMVPFQGHHNAYGQGQLHPDQIAAHAAYLARVASSSRMNAYTASLALRYTCEINRRLRDGTDTPPAYGNCNDPSCMHLHMDLIEEEDGPSVQPPQSQQSHHHQNQSWELQQHQWGDNNWNPPIRRPDPESERLADGSPPLSVFHAPSPSLGPRILHTGVKRWGIDLEKYLQQICESMGCANNAALVLARALIYLDRACSVETERQGFHGSSHHNNGGPPSYAPMAAPCPPLMPRTVHHLILTAVVLSCRAMRGQAGPEYDGAYAEHLIQFRITPNILSTMEATMRDALGFEGLYIDEHRLVHYLVAWGQTFLTDGKKEDDSNTNSDEAEEVLESSEDTEIDVESNTMVPLVSDAETTYAREESYPIQTSSAESS